MAGDPPQREWRARDATFWDRIRRCMRVPRTLACSLPFHTNFMRLRIASGFIAGFGPIAQVDPNFQDEHAVSPVNKAARDDCIRFLTEKRGDPELIKTMTPEHPVLSARPVLVEPQPY